MFKFALILLLSVSAIFAEESLVFKRFVEFTHKYEKVYSSIEEFQQKFETFKNNLIEVLSKDDFSGDHTVGITKFSDMTKDEFKQQYLTLKVQQGWCSQAKGLKFLSAPAPATLDWRDKGKVSPIKDQGQCGSCWAFSTVGFLESQNLIKNNNLVTFSEQQLVDCDKDFDQGCNGGLMHTALRYIQANGLESDKDYPYKARDLTCSYDKTKTKIQTNNVQCLENNSDEQIKEYLTNVGPLSIAVDASDFQMYSSGVLKCSEAYLNHGVLLVGYGADFWIVKNSWGRNWGESGFVRVSMQAGKNCGIGTYISYSGIQ
jgi:C1A family cysteine protease